MVSSIRAHVRGIWKRDERYGMREMRDMKRYGWNIHKERICFIAKYQVDYMWKLIYYGTGPIVVKRRGWSKKRGR